MNTDDFLLTSRSFHDFKDIILEKKTNYLSETSRLFSMIFSLLLHQLIN